MRARDYIAYNTESLKFTAEIIVTIDRFADLRDNYSKTNRCYRNHISTPEKWSNFIEKCNQKKVVQGNHWDFLQELKTVISADLSFTYLYSVISADNSIKLPTAERIRECIESQYENYPHEIIDDYLYTPINQSFALTLDNKEYTEEQEIEIFNSAYLLFDEIRKNLTKPRHASHLYKEFTATNNQVKDEVLRLLSYFIKSYDYDITIQQRDSLNTVADQLGNYINQRLSKCNLDSSLKSRWTELKMTLDNMISPEEKLKVLYTEKAEFLQNGLYEQSSIDVRFAEKCQIEIDKIEKIEEIESRIPKEYADGTRTLKVVADALYAILKEAEIPKHCDNTKISKIMGYITGYSPEKIRQRLSSPDIIPSRNIEEVNQANKYLSDINISELIKIKRDK